MFENLAPWLIGEEEEEDYGVENGRTAWKFVMIYCYYVIILYVYFVAVLL